jgi:hypothetical protein
MFGDGTLASCKPISERDLASFMADCVQQRDKASVQVNPQEKAHTILQCDMNLQHRCQLLTVCHLFVMVV